MSDPARKEHFQKVCSAVVDLLRQEFEKPLEAYAVLIFVKDGFEKVYDIRGSKIFGEGEIGHA
jgi:hypothetical protein